MKKEIRKRIETLPQLDRIEIKQHLYFSFLLTSIVIIIGCGICSACLNMSLWEYIVANNYCASGVYAFLGSVIMLFSTFLGIWGGRKLDKQIYERWGLNG